MEFTWCLRCVLVMLLFYTGTNARHLTDDRSLRTALNEENTDDSEHQSQTSSDFGYTNLFASFSSTFGLQNDMNLVKSSSESTRSQQYGHSVDDAGRSTAGRLGSQRSNSESESEYIPKTDNDGLIPYGNLKQPHYFNIIGKELTGHDTESSGARMMPTVRRRIIGNIKNNNGKGVGESMEYIVNEPGLVYELPSWEENEANVKSKLEIESIKSGYNDIPQSMNDSESYNSKSNSGGDHGNINNEMSHNALQRKPSLNWPMGSLESSDLVSDWSTGSSTKTTICPVFGPCPEECQTLMLSECPVCECQGPDGVLIHLNFSQTGYGSQVSGFGNTNNQNEIKDTGTNTHTSNKDLTITGNENGFHGYSNINSGGKSETKEPPVPHEQTTTLQAESDTETTTRTLATTTTTKVTIMKKEPCYQLTTRQKPNPVEATTSLPWSGTQKFPLMGGGAQQQTGNEFIGQTDFSSLTGGFPSQGKGDAGNGFMGGQDGNGMYGMMSSYLNGNGGAGKNEFGLSGQTGGTGMHQSQYGQNGAMSNSFNLFGTSGNLKPGAGTDGKDESGFGQTGMEAMSGFGVVSSQGNTAGGNSQNGFNGNGEFGQTNYNGMQSQIGTGTAEKEGSHGKANTEFGSVSNSASGNNFGSPSDFQSGFDFSKLLSHGSFNGKTSGFQYGFGTGSATADQNNNFQSFKDHEDQTSKGNGISEGVTYSPLPILQGESPLETVDGSSGTTGAASTAIERGENNSDPKESSNTPSASKSQRSPQNLNGCSAFPKNCRMECLSIGVGGCIECTCGDADNNALQATSMATSATYMPPARGSIFQQNQPMAGFSANNNGCPVIPMNCDPVDLSMDASGCIICRRASLDFPGTQKRNLPETEEVGIPTEKVDTPKIHQENIHKTENSQNDNDNDKNIVNHTRQEQNNNDKGNDDNSDASEKVTGNNKDDVSGRQDEDTAGTKGQRRNNKSNNNGCPTFSNNCPIQCMSIDELGCVVCSCKDGQSPSMTSSGSTYNNNGCPPFPTFCSPSCVDLDKMGCPVCTTGKGECESIFYSQSISSVSTLNLGGCQSFPQDCSPECTSLSSIGCPVCLPDCTSDTAIISPMSVFGSNNFIGTIVDNPETLDPSNNAGASTDQNNAFNTLNTFEIGSNSNNNGCPTFYNNCPASCTNIDERGCPICSCEASVATMTSLQTCPPSAENCDTECITTDDQGCVVCDCPGLTTNVSPTSLTTVTNDNTKSFTSPQPWEDSTTKPEDQSTSPEVILEGETTTFSSKCPMFDLHCDVTCVILDSNNCLMCSCYSTKQTETAAPGLYNPAFLNLTPVPTSGPASQSVDFQSTSTQSSEKISTPLTLVHGSHKESMTTISNLPDITTTHQSSTEINGLKTSSTNDPFPSQSSESPSSSFSPVLVTTEEESKKAPSKETTQHNDPKILTSTLKPDGPLKVSYSTLNLDKGFPSKFLNILKSGTSLNEATDNDFQSHVTTPTAQSTPTNQINQNNEYLSSTPTSSVTITNNSKIISLPKEISDIKEVAVTMETKRQTEETSQQTTMKGCPMFDLSCPVDCAIVDGMGCLVCRCASTVTPLLTSTPKQDDISTFSEQVSSFTTSLLSHETPIKSETIAFSHTPKASATASTIELPTSSPEPATKSLISSSMSYSVSPEVISPALSHSSSHLIQFLKSPIQPLTSPPPSLSSSSSRHEKISTGFPLSNSQPSTISSTLVTERGGEPVSAGTMTRQAQLQSTQQPQQVTLETKKPLLDLPSTSTQPSPRQKNSPRTSQQTHVMTTCPPTRCVFPCDIGITLGKDNCPICLCRSVATSLP